jgi:ubiquinone/menaquinone biosynthesis C-methylase UbiE
MSTTFHARNADAYEHFMGRWSRVLARQFIAFAGVRAGERLLDVGCGTGSLTFTLLDAAKPASIDAVDYSEIYLDAARQRSADARLTFRQADACALPFGDAAFDRTLSLLMLHFVPEAERAVAEMRRVTRPGGGVAAAVWDGFGGVANQRMFWDTAALVDPEAAALRRQSYFRPMTRPNEMAATWTRLGLVDVEETTLVIRMEYTAFDDYWAPLAAGEGGLGKYVAALPEERRRALEQAVRAAYEGGEPDGARSFIAAAWACRGTVPPA